jgi:hypothetical protein
MRQFTELYAMAIRACACFARLEDHWLEPITRMFKSLHALRQGTSPRRQRTQSTYRALHTLIVELAKIPHELDKDIVVRCSWMIILFSLCSRPSRSMCMPCIRARRGGGGSGAYRALHTLLADLAKIPHKLNKDVVARCFRGGFLLASILRSKRLLRVKLGHQTYQLCAGTPDYLASV